MVSFPVDDVVAVTDRLPTVSLSDVFPEALVIGGDPALGVLEPKGVHPLLHAVWQAFAKLARLVRPPQRWAASIGQTPPRWSV